MSLKILKIWKFFSWVRNKFFVLQEFRFDFTDHNLIKTISDQSFRNLKKMETLELNRNQLETLPDHLFEKLESLERLNLRE